MTDEVRLAQGDIKKPAVTVPVTMQGLWRLVTWGAVATTALLIAALASRGVVGSPRAAVAAATISTGVITPVRILPGPRPADTPDETKRLSDTVTELAAENSRIKTRLAAIEQDMSDVTGSIARQAQAANSATASPPWPDGPGLPSTPAAIAAVVAPALPLPMEYGADIGSALSVQALRARWLGIHSAHPQLFDGLVPTVTLREIPRSNSPELRLVVGPLVSADAAAHLCAALAAHKMFCEPTIFAGQHLALE
jgi:hypothetical protein